MRIQLITFITFYLIFCSASKAQDLIPRFEICNNCSDGLANDYTGEMPLPTTGFFTYDATQDTNTDEYYSDFGRRGGNSRWHKGVDFSIQAGNHDAGDHIMPLETGTITAIVNLAVPGMKIVVVEGEHIFGYGHLFFDVTDNDFPANGTRSGDMILQKMDGAFSNEYAVIYAPEEGDTIAYSRLNTGTVTHIENGDTITLNVTNQVDDINVPIGAMGNSGGSTIAAHLHLYSLTTTFPTREDVFNRYTDYTTTLFRTCKDPLQFLEYDEPDYDVSINTDNLTYVDSDYSSIYVRCEMEGETSGSVYQNAVMDIDNVELFIKNSYEESSSYELIKGVWLESKIIHGARVADGAEEATNRYPSPTFPTHNIVPPEFATGYNFPFDGVDIAHRLDDIGKGNANITGINPSAYSGSPHDDFYFSDIKLRIHKNDDYSDTEIDYAAINEDARYPDGWYDLYAKATTVKNVVHHSDTITPDSILIDNFRPYIKEVNIAQVGGIELYNAEWIWDEEQLQ